MRLFLQIKDVIPFNFYSRCELSIFFGLPRVLTPWGRPSFATFANLSTSIQATWAAYSFYFTSQVLQSCRKKVIFSSFFRNISKTAETILIKKIAQNHRISVYKKARTSKKLLYIFRDNNCFVKMYNMLVS